MKKYRNLKSIFHQYDREVAEREAYVRRSAGFETSFAVGEHKLFYTATPQLLVLQEQVLLNERTLASLAANIPLAAQRSYLYELITQEITATNEIEGVRSTRQEIESALEAEPYENKKFREIARLYLELSRGAVVTPRDCESIRTTYDGLFGSEISEDDQLDGNLFRAGPVDVRDGAGKEIQAGAKDEAEIKTQLQAMFTHLEDDDVPFVLSRIISHFMFEAVHPFYDGNGRFGRFLLSAQLQEVLSAYTVLTLSHIINRKKHDYYKAFTDVEEPLNFGEATSFAEMMLVFIREAQLELIADFSIKKEAMQLLNESIDSLRAEKIGQQMKVSSLHSLF